MTEMTKELLARSLKSLMEKSPLEKITVRDIVDGCSLNRRTFYYHFGDVYDLLSWLYKKEVIAELVRLATKESWADGFRFLLCYIRDNRDFCLCAFRSLKREYIEQYHYSVIYRHILPIIDSIDESRGVPDERKAFLANLYAVSFVALTVQWIQNGMQEDPNVLVDALETTIRGSMRYAVLQYRKESGSAKRGRSLRRSEPLCRSGIY
jgi:probable dihydroxyacetone kinase regulator